MPSSWNPPTEASVGEPIDLNATFCSPADTATEHDVTADGTPIISEAISDLAGQVCLDRGVGRFHTPDDENAFNNDSRFEAQNGNLVITESGTYTLTFSDGQLQDSQTITVTEPPFDSGAVSVNCAGTLPDQLMIGETVQVEAEVVNNNSVSADVAVLFEVGGASATKIVNVGGNTTTTVTDTFEAASAGDVDVSVEKTGVSEQGLSGTPHEPGTPAF
jgi:hypothetical protein